MPAREYEDLIVAARDAREHAYAPYSDFRAGAAVLTEDDRIHIGALVENLVFGAAMCAERVALFSSVAAGPSRPELLALVAPSTAGELTYPCGTCLQVAIELGGPMLEIVAASPKSDTYQVRRLDELAPGIPRRKRSLR